MVAWNVRGTTNKSSYAHIKSFGKNFFLSLMIILETHVVFEKSRSFWSKLGYVDVGLVKSIRITNAIKYRTPS